MGFFSSDTTEYVTEHENNTNLNIFLELVLCTVKIEDYISIVENILTEENTLPNNIRYSQLYFRQFEQRKN